MAVAAAQDLLSLARAVSSTGRGFVVRPDNRAGRWDTIDALVKAGEPFAVVPRDGLAVLDLDVTGLSELQVAARTRAFDQVASACRSAGLTPLIVASGRPGHRHLFVPFHPNFRHELASWAAGNGLDLRTQGIRPPLVPHRATHPPTLLEPATPGAARRCLEQDASPGASAAVLHALSAPRLSQRMRRLLREGHAAVGYQSPSHGRMALAVAARAAGFGPTWLETALRDPRNRLGDTYRGRPRNWQRDELDRLWSKAGRWLEGRPARPAPITGREDALDTLAHWVGALRRVSWAGMAGATDLAVAEALATYGARAGGVVLAAAQADVAIAAGVSEDTARRSLRRLVHAGWCRIEYEATATYARTYRLTVPDDLSGGAPPVSPADIGQLGADLARWAGIGKSAARVLRELHADQAVTLAALSDRLRATRTAIRLQLRKLSHYGLAVAENGGWRLGPADPDMLADQFGVAGRAAQEEDLLARRRQARQQLRAAWRAAYGRAQAALAEGDTERFVEQAAVLPRHILQRLATQAPNAPPGQLAS